MCLKPYTIHPKDAKEQPIHLEQGDIVVVPIFAFHRDPKYFTDPENFNPERFNEENKLNIQPFSYMPFGFGPRNCIGKQKHYFPGFFTQFLYFSFEMNFFVSQYL